MVADAGVQVMNEAVIIEDITSDAKNQCASMEVQHVGHTT